MIQKLWRKKASSQTNRLAGRSFWQVLLIVVVIGGWGGYAMHLPGCSMFKRDTPREIGEPVEKPDLNLETEAVENSAGTIGDIADSVEGSADSIDEQTVQIRSTVPSETGAVIDGNLDAIDAETTSLRDDSAELRRVRSDLEEVRDDLVTEQGKVDDLESAARVSLAEIEDLREQNNNLKSEASQLFKQKMAWIGVISVFGIGVCVILAFLTRSTAATLVAIGFVVTLGVSIAVSLYMATIAWITIAVAGVSVVGVLGYMGYNTFVQNKSVDELVQTGEVTKNYLSQEARDYIFGRGAEPGVADQVQSKETKKLVRQLRQYDVKKRGFDLAPREVQVARLPRVPETQTYVLDGAQEVPSF
jgi:hypothetical protein